MTRTYEIDVEISSTRRAMGSKKEAIQCAQDRRRSGRRQPRSDHRSDGETAVILSMAERLKTARPGARYKFEKTDEGRPTLRADHPEPALNAALLHDTFATTSADVATGLRDQIMQVSRTGSEFKAEELNRMLAIVRGISPRDETEALLACQMAAIHNAIMVAARRLNHVENIPQQDSSSNMFNKLARTFAMQMDTLKRYRATGTQTIQVQHVTVNEGGQAIVGPVTQHRGGASDESSRQPHAPEPTGCVEAAGCAPLLSHIEAVAAPMPGAGGQGLEGVPVPRRARRRA